MKHISSQVNQDKQLLESYTDDLIGDHKLWWSSLEHDEQTQLTKLYYNTLTPVEQLEVFGDSFNSNSILGLAGDMAACIRPDEKQSLSLKLAYMIEEAIEEHFHDLAEEYYNGACDFHYQNISFNDFEFEDYTCDAQQRSRDMKITLGQLGGAA